MTLIAGAAGTYEILAPIGDGGMARSTVAPRTRGGSAPEWITVEGGGTYEPTAWKDGRNKWRGLEVDTTIPERRRGRSRPSLRCGRQFAPRTDGR